MMIRSSTDLKELTTASAVIDAVGGTVAAQKLTQRRFMQSISNWRSSGRLPPDTFLIFSEELVARGFRAPSTLWGITPAGDGVSASR
jgi:hypothetical protein